MYCKEKGIVLAAYSPLGQPKTGTAISPVLSDPEVKRIAEKYGVQAGTVSSGLLINIYPGPNPMGYLVMGVDQHLEWIMYRIRQD